MNQPFTTQFSGKTSLFFLTVCLLLSVSPKLHAQTDKSALKIEVQKAEAAAANSISFIENKGQWPGHVLYRADIPGGQMLATPQGMLIGKFDPQSLAAVSDYNGRSEEFGKYLSPDAIAEKLGPRPILKGHGWKFDFIGGSLPNPQSIAKSGESKDYYNYLMGAGATDATNVHSYSELVYKNVYQGIDVRYYTASAGDLENDIIIHPGADCKLLKLKIEGIENMKLNSDGSLVLPTTVGDISIPHPVSYLKDEQGNTTKIDVTYQLTGSNELSFKIPDYDKSKTLVIDPIVMRWATWLTNTTGTSDGHNHGIEVDASGNIYTTGRIGTDMLVTTGAFQTVDSGSTNLFIAEYQEPATPGGTGTRVWQTYMGTGGGDNPYAMSIGTNNNLYITGLTSGNFQRTYGSGGPASSWTTQRTCNTTIKQQAFVAEVSDSGKWALVREIGPATDNYFPQPYDIRVISTGASTFDLVVVASVIQQSNATDGDVPAAITPAGTAKTGTGDLNGYVFRISSDLNTIRWAEQYTSSGNNNDQFNIANVDASGNIYVAGYTRGSSGISYNNPSGQTGLVGTADGWLMKLTGSTGAALWSRYFNAAASDSLTILCMELNSNQTNLIMGGTTTGLASYNNTNAAVTYGGKGDFFVASVPVTGGATNWGTYYGGSGEEYNMMGLNVDQNNDIYVLAYTYSKNIHAVDFPVQDSSYNTTTTDRQAIFFKLTGSTGDTVLYSTYLGGSGDDYDPIGERGIKFSNCRIYLCMTAASNDFPLTEGTLTPTKTSSNSTLDPMLISMANPPDLQGNGFTGGQNQTTTCGVGGLTQITAGTASYVIPTITRGTTNETNGTKQAYPDGLPTVTGYQWQVSTDTGTIWTNIPGATNESFTPDTLTTTGLIEYRRIVDGDACTPINDTVGVAFITVDPTNPAPTIFNNSPLCAGQTLQLTADSVTGASYSWTGPNGFTSTQRNPIINNVTTAAAGVYQCTMITISNGCPSYPSTTPVSITAQPAAPTAGSNSPVCTGQTLHLNASGTAGNTFSWTGPNNYVSALDSPSISNVTSVNAGTYYVTQAVGSCVSPATPVIVVIDTISLPTSVSANPNPLCSGQTLTLSATPLSGATLNWTFPGGGTASGSPVILTNVTTAMSGNYSVTQSLNGCTSNAVTVNVTINQTPGKPTVTAPDSLCAGSTLTLTASGVAGATYTWTYPGGGGTTGNPITRTGVTSAMGGIYTVTQTSNGCTSTVADSVTVVVNPLPIVTVGSTVSKYCSGGTLSLTSTVTGSSPFTYVWSGPDTFSRTIPDPTRGAITPAMSGIYDLTVTDTKGCTAAASTAFIPVNQSPTVIASSNNTSYCTGGTIDLTATPSSGSTFTYSWSGPNSFSSRSQDTTVSATTAASGTYTVIATDSNGCTATGSTSAIVVHTSPLVTAASLTPTYCSGATISLSSTVTGGTPTFTYSWSGPDSFSNTQPNPTIANSTTAMSGIYTVTVTDNNSCTAKGSTSSITVYQSPSITASASSAAYCAGTTIVLNSSPSSGTTPYTYSWSGPASFTSQAQDTTRPNATTAMSGIYTVIVTDAHSCTATASTSNVTVNPGFTVNASSNSPVCAGGTLNLTSSSTGGTAPFTYKWSATGFSSISQDTSRTNASAGMAGVYSVTITDHNGCSAIGTDTVVVNPATTITVTSNSPICSGDSISLLATPNSGTSPFAYTWSGPASFSSNISDPGRTNATTLMGGTYLVTVTDHNGCSGTGSASVTVNQSPSIIASAGSSAYCAGTTIVLNSSPSSGTTPYTYSWSGPASFVSHAQDTTRTNSTTAMSGIYTVTVTDAHGCTASASTNNVTVNPSLTVNASSNSPVCAGGTLELTSSSTGGTAPFTYQWSATGFSSISQDTSRTNASAAMAGIYSVTITDHNGCSATGTDTVVVNPATTINVTSNSPVCVGDSISLSATPASGTSPFVYTWSGPSFSSTQPNPVISNATTLMSGTYLVTVTDHNGCSGTGSTSVVVNPLPSVTATATAPGYCVNTTIQLGATPSLGTPPYVTYSWSGPPAYTSNSQTPSIINADTLMAGTYTVTVTDSKGCSAQNSVSIAIYTLPVVTAGAGQTSCSGANVTLGGSPTASGGNPPYIYVWNNGADSSSNPTVDPTSTTTYTVTVTDNKSCSATASALVSVNSNPSANAGSNQTIPSCSLVGAVLGGNPTASGGIGPYTYNWAPSAGLSSSDTSNPVVQGIGSTTPYTVTVTDHNGCTASSLVTITVTGSSLSVDIKPTTTTSWCASGSTSVILVANPSGGNGSYTYAWTGTSLSSTNTDSTIANPNIAGTYIYGVIVTDSTGCQAGDTISITVYPVPSANAGAANYFICNGDSVALGGNPTANGGTSPYTYTWNNSAASVPSPTVDPTSNTTYTVTVSDAHNCTATASSTVNVRSNPVASAGPSVTLPACSPTGIQIGGNPTGSGGAGGTYTYGWSPPNGLSSTTIPDPIVQGIANNQTYTVTVSDSNGCSATANVLVNVSNNPPMVSISAGGSTSWCAGSGDSVVLTANVTGGTGSDTYVWSGTSISPLNAHTATVDPDTANTYTYYVTVTDGFNCTAANSISVNVYANPTANAGSPDTICHGDTVTLGGNPTANGGTSPYSYTWNNGAASISDPSVHPTSNTTYTVTVSDAHSCTATASVSVDVRSNPIASAGSTVTLPACSPTGIQIGGAPTAQGGAGGYTYAWSPPTGLSSTSVSNPTVQGITSNQTYTVTVTDINGCSSSAQVTVQVSSNPPSVSIFAGGSTSWCAGSGDSVFLAANVTGGTGTITYVWSGTSITPLNAPTATVDPNTAGTYTYYVTVTDGFNCTATASKVVNVNANPSADAGSPNYTICNGDSVTIGGNPTASGGNGTYTYTWSGGALSVSNPTVDPTSNTTYTVTVKDGNSCTATASTAVTVRANPIANAGTTQTMPACTPTGVVIGGNPTASGGGGAPYTYSWSPSVGLSSTTVSNPTVVGLINDTTYKVTVTDVNGCSASAQVTVNVTHNTPSVNITTSGSTSWCAGTNSSVNLTANVTGGTGTIAYSWSGADINPVNSQVTTVYPNSAGTYTYIVTVTDGFNCTATASRAVDVNAIPTASAGTPIQIICAGTSVTIGGNPTASGGTAPYTYSWNSGANAVPNPTVNPTNSTTYVVTVTDSVGCSATASTTVLVRPTVNANAGNSQTITSCIHSCATLGGTPTGSGGSGTLTYAWGPSTGLSSTTVPNPTACNLSANQIYTVTVTDTAGCTASAQVSITVVPSSLTAEAGTGGAFCLGSGDSVMLGGYPTAVGGTPAYTYTWSPANGLNLVNPANPVAYPTATTTYYLTITDAQGCTAVDSSQVRVFQAVQVNAGNDTSVCGGSPVRLGGNPTATGGNGTYTYAWTPSTNVSNITLANPIATPFTTTTYTVVVTDGNGCHGSSDMLITVRLAPTAEAGNDQNINACALDSIVIGGSPSGLGGTPPYTYSWSPPTGLSGTSIPNPIVAGITSSQTYTLVVTDSAGCSGSDNVVVTVVPSTLQAYQANTEQICGGPNSCIQLGGLPTAIGGVSPYTYSWSGTLSNPTSSNPIACPTSNTTYDVTITDSHGCSVTASQSVVVNPSPVVNAGNDTAVCMGQSVRLGGNPSASGGSGRGFIYSWTPTTGISSSTIANPIATATATTTYTLEVTDSDGCSASANILVTVNPLPVANAGQDKSISICSNDSIFIGNIPVATGGTPPYTYLWSPATGLSSTTVPNPGVSGITQTTSYQIVVTDTFGCTASSNVIVTVTQSTLQAEAGNVRVTCASAGTPVTIGGSPTAQGGTPPYVYNWAPAAGLSSTTVPNPIATVSSTTTYYLTVTDSKGCVATDSIKITQNTGPTADAGRDTAVCSGFGVVLGGSPTATGGSGSYQYSWTPTTGLSANNTSNPSAFPLTTTTYEVIVTDSNGCQAAAAVTIVVNQNPTANAGPDQTITTCSGDTVQIGGTPAASGGAGGYIYAWSPGTGLSSSSAPNPFVTGISSSSLYALTVTDANGCSASSATLVTVTHSTLSANAGNNTSICAGSNTIVTLGSSPTAVGGTGPYTYVWSPSSSLNSGSVSNPFATPTVTTGYSVTVTDSKGCVASDSVTVTVNPAPVVQAGRDTTVCAGNAVVVGGNPTASGGTTPYIYSWSPTIGVSNASASNPTINPIATTTYAVTVTDAHGCAASDDVVITVHQNPVANAGVNQSIVACNADSVMIGGTPSASGGQPPYTYLWSPAASVSSDSIPNPYVSHLGSSSTFTLLVTDEYGCTASSQVLITVTNSTLFANAGNNVTVCQGSSGLVILGGTPTASGGTPNYTYTWSPAAGLSSTTVSNPDALPSQTTQYTVVVKDAAGCIASDTMDFIINPRPVVDAGPNDTICQGTCVNIGGAPTGNGPLGSNTYLWSPSTGLNDPTLSNPTACSTSTTRYTVTVTNQNNCTASASMTVKVNPLPVVSAGPDQTIVACPNSCITIGGSPTASGGTGPYTYTWSPSIGIDTITSSNPLVCDLKTNVTYSVTVVDANGCSASSGTLIQPVLSTLTADAGSDKSTCAGAGNCITIGGSPAVSGGSTPYTIHWSPVTSFCGSSTIGNPQVDPTATTTYTLFVTDALGCTAYDSVTVNANPAVTAIVNPDTTVCSGATAVLGGYPTTGSGGTPPYTYSWSPTIGISSPGSSNPTVNTIITTTYCVTVTDSVGCSTSACQAVDVVSPLTADAGPDKTLTGCPNSNVVLGGTPAVTGGSGHYSYSWTPATGLDSANIANPTVQNLSTTTLYTLSVTDLLTGCSATDQVLVTVAASNLTVNAGTDQFLCYNNTSGVQIGGIPSASGGQGPYTYVWTPAQGLNDTSVANPIALPTDTTTYVLSITDALGCTLTDSVTVSVVPRIPVSISGLSPKYCLNANNVTLSGSPAGGTFSGPGIAGNTFEPSVIGIGNWCIKYSYTDPISGCSSDTTVCIVVDSIPAISISGYKPTYCHLDSPVTLIASPAGGTFSGPGISGDIFNPANANSGANLITYTYTDTVLGCSNTTQFSIAIDNVPTITISASDSQVCSGAPVVLSAQYSTDVFNIAWANMSGTTIYSGLNAFTANPTVANSCYVATAINASQCVTRDTICIPLADCYISTVNLSCDEDSTYMNTAVTINALANDTLPASGIDTTITIIRTPSMGSAAVNADNTITFTPQADFSGDVNFEYQVCVVVKGFSVCDTADVCINVVDTNVYCHFPNTITPNGNSGMNGTYIISCNDQYPNAVLNIYDRWGAEVYRSGGHYLNDWQGTTQEGKPLPDGTYFYMYYYNDGSNRVKSGFVDVYR